MKKLIAFLLMIPSIAVARVHTMQGDVVTFSSITATGANGIRGSSLHVSSITFSGRTANMRSPGGTSLMAIPDVQTIYFGEFSAVNPSAGGTFNSCFGTACMGGITTGNFNTAVGNSSMGSGVLTGEQNNAMGYAALNVLAGGSYNVAMGGSALLSLISGAANTAIGTLALGSATGDNNTAVGYDASRHMTTGVGNTSVGYQAMAGTTTITNSNVLGNYNTHIGFQAGQGVSSSTVISKSIAIGYRAFVSTANEAQIGGRPDTGNEVMVRMTSATVERHMIGPSFNSTTSSVTFTGSSGLTVLGSGDGEIVLTIAGSTRTVVSSDKVPSVGNVAVYTSTWSTVGGSGSFNWSGSSLSVVASPVAVSTLTVLGGGTASSNNTASTLNVYRLGTGGGGSQIASFGTDQQANQFTVIDQQPVRNTLYGGRFGSLNVGLASFLDKVMSVNSTNQHFNAWNTGHLELQTCLNGDGGKDIIFKPQTVEAVRVSSTTSLTISAAGALSGYALKVSTSATFTQVAISTSGHVHASGTKPVLSSCGTSPSIIGSDTAFTVTVGGTAAACTITFVTPFNTIPTCVVSDQTVDATNVLTYTVSATAVGLAKTGLDDEKVDVICIGH